MIQALLAERFQTDSSTTTSARAKIGVMRLIVGKGGPKLEASVEGDELKPEPPGPFPGGPPFPGPLGGAGARVSPGENCAMHMEFPKAKMSTLADTLTPFVDRPVIDQTELKGDYKITLDHPHGSDNGSAMMQNQGGGPRGPGGPPGGPGGGGPRGGGPPVGCPDPGTAASDASSAPIFQAVQHLGLKLQARKAPFDTIVVDHLDKTPTDN